MHVKSQLPRGLNNMPMITDETVIAIRNDYQQGLTARQLIEKHLIRSGRNLITIKDPLQTNKCLVPMTRLIYYILRGERAYKRLPVLHKPEITYKCTEPTPLSKHREKQLLARYTEILAISYLGDVEYNRTDHEHVTALNELFDWHYNQLPGTTARLANTPGTYLYNERFNQKYA